ncbi:MAG: NAD-dependent epimerase/dehydratase family protein [Candidatus Micrarchaeota archaeon]|nr:NAD-dependent epimerase/dehydratase family protein [Candidatus Micrarchaeota archaeon]
MRIAITGGAGFIGSRIAKRLHENGHDVNVIDHLQRAKQEGIEMLRNIGVDITREDVTSPNLAESFKSMKPDAVVHAAALISVKEAEEKPELYDRVNSGGTLNALLAARAAGAGHFVYMGSSAVYGNPRYLPIDEKHPTNPISIYGASKLNGEIYANYFRAQGMKVFIPRLFNVYGTGQNPEYSGVITIFKRKIEEGKNLVVYGDGRQTRDFVHVNDVAEIVCKGIESEVSETVNIGTGKPVTINEIAEKMIELSGANLSVEHAKALPSDVLESVADTKLMERLGFKPRVSLEIGLGEFFKRQEN